jgi:hypothetical protein
MHQLMRNKSPTPEIQNKGEYVLEYGFQSSCCLFLFFWGGATAVYCFNMVLPLSKKNMVLPLFAAGRGFQQHRPIGPHPLHYMGLKLKGIRITEPFWGCIHVSLTNPFFSGYTLFFPKQALYSFCLKEFFLKFDQLHRKRDSKKNT